MEGVANMWWGNVVIILCFSAVITFFAVRNKQMKRELEYLVPMIQVAENARDILYYCEVYPVMKYRYLSQGVGELFGENSKKQHMENPELVFDIVHPDDYETLMNKLLGKLDYSKPILLRLRNDEGEYIWFEEFATPIYENGRMVAVQGIYRNIEAMMKLNQELEYRATHDHLSACYNRDYFEKKIEYYNEKEDIPMTVLICDLDNLKKMNDSFGHKMGDTFIRETAKILKQTVGDLGIVSRIGGDEFSVLLPRLTYGEVDDVLAQMTGAINQYNETVLNFKISLSIGQASCCHSVGNLDRLLIIADNEMYKNKKAKKITELAYHY